MVFFSFSLQSDGNKCFFFCLCPVDNLFNFIFLFLSIATSSVRSVLATLLQDIVILCVD